MDIGHYKTLVFDCDGVILNSNCIKTDAFRCATLPYGYMASEALVAYHVAHGGVSRYAKFEYFIKHIIPEYHLTQESVDDKPGLDALLSNFATIIKTELLKCDIAEGLTVLRKITANSRWLIASGSDQVELREIFSVRNLDHLFDGGIFGSPESKHDIVKRELDSGRIVQPVLFLGDSKLDHEVAAAFDFDFVFVSQWSEFAEWQDYCKCQDIPIIRSLSELME